MKKITLTFFIALFSLNVFSQTVKADTAKKEFKNSIGVDVTVFIKQFVVAQNSLGGYYYNFPTILSYRRYMGSNAIRVGIGGYVFTNDGRQNDTMNSAGSRNSYNLRAGFEHYNYLGKRWMYYIGADALMAYSSTTNKQSTPAIVFTQKNESYSYGISPLIGFTFQINARLTIASEASYDFTYVQSTSSSTNTMDPLSNRHSKGNSIASQFNGPELINLRIKF